MQKETKNDKTKDCPTFIDPGLMMRNIIDSDRSHVVSQLVKAMAQYSDKEILMCPYNPGGHWVLIVIPVKHNHVWYMDSAKPMDAKGNRKARDYKEVANILNE
jgi:hypothetical protein